MLRELKKGLKEMMEQGGELREAKEGVATTSKFNFFRRQRLKFKVSGGISDLKKRIYDFEKHYYTYKECLSLNQQSVLVPYVKLLFGVLATALNALLVIDLWAKQLRLRLLRREHL